MNHFKKTVRINVPVAQVFDYLTQPLNLLEIWPSMMEITNAKRSQNGANSFDWVYKMAGIRFNGHADTIRVETNRYLEIENKAGIKSIFRWTYEARGENTDLTLEVEYDIPVPLIGKIAETFLVKLNDREAETLLANLKERMETTTQLRPAKPQEKHV